MKVLQAECLECGNLFDGRHGRQFCSTRCRFNNRSRRVYARRRARGLRRDPQTQKWVRADDS